MKPFNYLNDLSHNKTAEIVTNAIGMLCLLTGGIGFFAPNIVNEKKSEFIMDLVNHDPETCHWINEIQKAAYQEPPNKKAAKEAFKHFKDAVRQLQIEPKWKEHKKALKAQLKLKKNPTMAE